MSEGVRLNGRSRRPRSWSDRCADALCDMRCLVAITGITMIMFISILVVGMTAQTVRDVPAFGPMIIDTDAGIDDAVALMMALEAEKRFYSPQSESGPKIIAITTVNGNTGAVNVSRNVLRLLSLENRTDIPVFQGATRSIKVSLPSNNYFGGDGFGDVPDASAPTLDLLQKTHAAVALVELVNKYEGEITLFCIGPLTNVALAIRLDENFLTKLKHLYIMGGSTRGTGNVEVGVEFNFHRDPEANYIVLKDAARNRDSVTIITLEPILEAEVTKEWRVNILGKLTSERVKFLNTIEHIGAMSTEGLWDPADPAVIAVALDPKLVLKKQNVGLVVVTDGEFRGGVLADYIGLHPEYPTVELIDSINREGLKSILLDFLGA